MSEYAIRAGLDEAGYGPLLGPLTVGFSAFRADPGTPVDWTSLAGAVTDDPRRDGELPVVADSKRVFTRNPRGAARLETTALAFLRVAGSRTTAFEHVLASGPAALRPCSDTLATHPWYGQVPSSLPMWTDADRLDERARDLGSALERAATEIACCGVSVIPSGTLNASFRATDNKAATLWWVHSTIIADLFERFGGEGLDLTVDRLGGRARYGGQLAVLLPFSTVTVRSESRAESIYDVQSAEKPDQRRMRIRFVQKGDASSLPVALGSCLAKYARETVMEAFNRFFGAVCPSVKPTAGYVTDARRWLADVEQVAPKAIAQREMLVRSR